MSDEPEADRLADAARLRSERQRSWLRGGEASIAGRLAQIGVLGWMVVTPMLLGLFIGRWLDGLWATGIMFTAALLFVGLAAGCWSAWTWMVRA